MAEVCNIAQAAQQTVPYDAFFVSKGASMNQDDSRLQATSPLRHRFTHRPLDNGSVESICMNCFLTISRTSGEFKLTPEELKEIESAHQCDQTHRPIKPKIQKCGTAMAAVASASGAPRRAS